MINQRIFSANVGDVSTGQAGPDAIEQDIDNLLANDQELLGITGSKANKTQPNWITAILQNGWTGILRYRKNEIGQIEIEGNITAGNVSIWTVIAILPYAPIKNAQITAIKGNSVVLNDVIRFNINKEIQIIKTSTNLATGNTDIHINSIIN